ncbi:465_t:CDS:2, partial [Funneliformis geosporum]
EFLSSQDVIVTGKIRGCNESKVLQTYEEEQLAFGPDGNAIIIIIHNNSCEQIKFEDLELNLVMRKGNELSYFVLSKKNEATWNSSWQA